MLTLGNPALWWVGTLGLVTALVAWIRNPTWRWSLPLVCVLATWAPWWITSGRPIRIGRASRSSQNGCSCSMMPVSWRSRSPVIRTSIPSRPNRISGN